MASLLHRSASDVPTAVLICSGGVSCLRSLLRPFAALGSPLLVSMPSVPLARAAFPSTLRSAFVRSSRRSPSGAVVSLSFASFEVAGSVARFWSAQVDSAQHITMQLATLTIDQALAVAAALAST
jgi:hypothetical protein